MDENLKFNEFVRKLRIDKGFTLRVAAEKIDIASPYLSRIESGLEKPPSTDCLKRMADAYDVSLDMLLGKASNRAKEMYGDLVVSNPALNVFFKVVRNLPEDKILEAIESVCKENNLDPQQFLQEIQRRKVDLPRLRRVSEGLFAAEIEPRFLSKIKIEKMAYRFLAKHGLTPDTYFPPTPIERLIDKEEDIRLYIDDKLKMFKNGEPMELGMSHWSPVEDNVREIRINHALERDNRFSFTLGHELFHCLEHLTLMDETERTVDALRRAASLIEVNKRPSHSDALERWFNAADRPKKLETSEDWREWQADYFSACVLMPDWSVRKEFEKRFSIDTIKVEEKSELKRMSYEVAREKACTAGLFEQSLNQLFEVSAQAMSIKLMNLGLVSS